MAAVGLALAEAQRRGCRAICQASSPPGSSGAASGAGLQRASARSNDDRIGRTVENCGDCSVSTSTNSQLSFYLRGARSVFAQYGWYGRTTPAPVPYPKAGPQSVVQHPCPSTRPRVHHLPERFFLPFLMPFLAWWRGRERRDVRGLRRPMLGSHAQARRHRRLTYRLCTPRSRDKVWQKRTSGEQMILRESPRRVPFAFKIVLRQTIAFAAASFVFAGSAATEARPRVKIAFVGDSVADGYWDGVTRRIERDECLNAHLEVRKFTRDSTGLMYQHHI